MATDGPGLQFNNPMQGDASVRPSFGWMVVAFQYDNPSAWLFHCHIAVRDQKEHPPTMVWRCDENRE